MVITVTDHWKYKDKILPKILTKGENFEGSRRHRFSVPIFFFASVNLITLTTLYLKIYTERLEIENKNDDISLTVAIKGYHSILKCTYDFL